MKTFKRIAACTLAAAMVAGMTACVDEGQPIASGSGNAPVANTTTTQDSTTTDPDENAATDKDIKEVGTDTFTPSGNAGKVTFLNFYKIEEDQKGVEQSLIFKGEQYGGDIEYIICASGDAYLEKFSQLISSDESPDLVTKDVFLYPGSVSKNLFEPLDNDIDMNSPLWADMADVIESYAYQGKHYYYPHRITTSFALNYSKKTIEENGLPDPYELYKNGEWTWDAWRNMMIEFCDKADGNVGYYTTDTIITSLIATTGTTLIDTRADGTILNNIGDANVTRAMNFYETLYRDGVAYGSKYEKQWGDWVPPQTFADHCDQLLFLGMEPEWTYTAATEQIQNKTGVENDILDTVSDFAFVPYPRDVDADDYYQAYDTYGFLVPRGAKNKSGAVEFINCFRVYDTDEAIAAQVREDHVNPAPITYQTGKYEGQRKWVIKWGEQEYDMWREMCDPSKFNFVTEDAFGFNSDFWTSYAEVLTGVALSGESWAQKSSEFMPIVEAVVNEYRFSE